MKDKKSPKARSARETNPNVLRVALVNKHRRKIEAKGQFEFPCAPSMVDVYVKVLTDLFASLARVFNEAEARELTRKLKKHADEAFAASQYARLVVEYQTELPPHPGIAYTIKTKPVTMGDEYATWVDLREGALFGVHPDAKIMRLAAEFGAPAEVAVLDVGAGTGRNTLPLARAGFRADAVELAPALAKILRDDVRKEGLPVTVYEGDALDPALPIPEGHYHLVALAEVVASHFRKVGEIRALAERCLTLLRPGGVLLFNAFVPSAGYKPDQAARELSQIAWCCAFTRADLEEAMAGLPYDRVGDESVHDYEEEHQPKESWPPTVWFVNWSQGSDLFELPAGRAPLELRWLSYRKRG